MLPHPIYRRSLMSATALVAVMGLVLVAMWGLPALQFRLSTPDTLALHTFLEVASISVSVMLFSVNWHGISRDEARIGPTTLAAVSFAGVALLDFVHTMSYQGMPVFLTAGYPGKAIGFFLAARLIAGIALLCIALAPAEATFSPATRLRVFIGTLALALAAIYVGLWRPEWVPVFLVPGQGLTPVKVAIEYVIVAINLVTAALFFLRMRRPQPYPVVPLFAAALVMAQSEWFFTLYATTTDHFINMAHVHKIVAYLLVYRAIFVKSVRTPFEVLRATERDLRAANAEIDVQRRQVQSIVSSAMDAIVTVDEARRIVVYNDAAERMFGVPRMAAIGEPLDRFIPERFRARHGEQMRQFGEDRVTSRAMGRLGGVTALRADGTEFPVEASISSALLGERRLYTVIMRDVTERVAAERRITSLGRLYAALAQSNAAIVRIGDWRELCTTVCRIIVEEAQVAAAVVRIPDAGRGQLTPYARHGAAGGRVGRLEVPLTESGHPLIRAYRTGRAELVRDIRAEPTMVMSHHAASEFGLHAALMLPLKSPSGVIGVLSVVAERSDHFDGELGQLLAELADNLVFAHDKLRNDAAVRESEQHIREINASLEARIAERTAALTQANRTLDASNRDLEAFSYSVAHDLRAPLRSMSGFAQLLHLDLEAGKSGELHAHADRIVASAARMNALIDGLLAVARVSHAQLASEPVDCARLVAETIRDLPDAGRVRFEVADLPVLVGDRAALRQVWTNLLSNAVKYSARQPAPAVSVAWERGAGEAVFTVRDNGVGFNQAEAGRLFGVFQRLHAQADFEGTGVGLAIVQRIVERHDGRIWAESSPGSGAVFRFALPAARLADGASA